MKNSISLVLTLCCVASFGQSGRDTIRKPIDPRAYQDRGGRFEGFYRPDRAGGFDVLNTTKGEFKFVLKPGEVIKLFRSEPIPKSSTYNVKAHSVSILGDQFKMDKEVKGNDTLNWPVDDVLYRSKLDAAKLGVRASIPFPDTLRHLPPPIDRVIFLPIEFRSSAVSTDKKLSVILQSTIDLYELKYKVSELRKGKLEVILPARKGETARKDDSDMQLLKGFMPKNSKVRIPIPATEQALVYVELVALNNTRFIKTPYAFYLYTK